MNRTWWLAPLVVVAAGCSTPAPAVSAPTVSLDSQVLQVLDQHGIKGTPESLLAAAHQICDLAPTMTFLGITQSIARGTGLSIGQAGAFYGAATTAYCPGVSSHV